MPLSVVFQSYFFVVPEIFLSPEQFSLFFYTSCIFHNICFVCLHTCSTSITSNIFSVFSALLCTWNMSVEEVLGRHFLAWGSCKGQLHCNLLGTPGPNCVLPLSLFFNSHLFAKSLQFLQVGINLFGPPASETSWLAMKQVCNALLVCKTVQAFFFVI